MKVRNALLFDLVTFTEIRMEHVSRFVWIGSGILMFLDD